MSQVGSAPAPATSGGKSVTPAHTPKPLAKPEILKFSGSYSIKGYTLTLTYGDGHKEQMFAFALPGTNGKPKLDLLRLGGSSYTVAGK